VTVLPDWLKRISSLLPIRYSIEGMRAALLGTPSWAKVFPSLAVLVGMAALLLPVSLLCFSFATRRARIWGTLAQY
jgi:ABC-2 type transport system permease protein